MFKDPGLDDVEFDQRGCVIDRFVHQFQSPWRITCDNTNKIIRGGGAFWDGCNSGLNQIGGIHKKINFMKVDNGYGVNDQPVTLSKGQLHCRIQAAAATHSGSYLDKSLKNSPMVVTYMSKYILKERIDVDL